MEDNDPTWSKGIAAHCLALSTIFVKLEKINTSAVFVAPGINVQTGTGFAAEFHHQCPTST